MPKEWVPPIDTAKNVLLVRQRTTKGVRFRQVQMNHKLRGCGGTVRKFRVDGKTQLVVAKGRWVHAGYHYLLDWTQRIESTQEAIESRTQRKGNKRQKPSKPNGYISPRLAPSQKKPKRKRKKKKTQQAKWIFLTDLAQNSAKKRKPTMSKPRRKRKKKL